MRSYNYLKQYYIIKMFYTENRDNDCEINYEK